MIDKPHAPACERNREPILHVLREHVRDRRQLLEIGSGTGQHAVYFAAAMPWLIWQCSDRVTNLPGIRAWLDDAGLANTPAPRVLDVATGPWPVAGGLVDGIGDDLAGPQPRGGWDAAFTANTLHIMDWHSVTAFFAGLHRHLALDATLIVYGPFNYGGVYSSESNRLFDGWLKAGDAGAGAGSGIRDFEAIDALAQSIGLYLVTDVAMPANNRCLVWRRGAAPMQRAGAD